MVLSFTGGIVLDTSTMLGLLIPAMPLLSFLVIAFLSKKYKLASALISIFAIIGSFALSAVLLWAQLDSPHSIEINIPWMYLGEIKVHIGVLINQLTVIMLMVVTTVSLLVQIYSIGYMHGDEGFSRFFSYISIFSFSMLMLVISNNFIQIYMFWELVGLCSYLLIGFWYNKPEAAAASKKAFIVTRLGDFGFLLGIIILTSITNTYNFIETEAVVKTGIISPAMMTLIVLLLFSGAAGKSGQFPLHVWLPDAMAGPTPVSALIHAATMVAAGVFIVARLFPLFSSSHDAMLVIAYLGAFTAIFSASIALVQDDIKRVLAYSTLSQLGYMMLALGVGGYAAGMFHLTTHSAFKALLFLGAGNVIHASNTNIIWKMGGLGKKMPITMITFAIATFAIAGIFPFAGFWSKDEILVTTLNSGHEILYYVAIVTAFMTAFYMARVFFVTFTGSPKTDDSVHPHEMPLTMTVPLIILALLSIFIGFIGVPGTEKNITTFLMSGHGSVHESGINWTVAITSTIVAISGFILAFLIYSAGLIKPETLKQKSGFIYTILKNKFYVDEFYLFILDKTFFLVSSSIAWFDRHVIDGTVDLAAYIVRESGNRLRVTISGKVEQYALFVFLGMVAVIAGFAIYNPDALKLFGGR
jgi:NADH-quinone oxidoreductase subunit L